MMNIPTLIGAIIGCYYGGWFSDKFVEWYARRNNNVFEAEHRLWLMYPAAFIGSAGLMLFGIGTDMGMNWPAPYVGLGMIGFGWGCAGDLSLAYLQDAYPEMVLEGMVGVSVINNSIGCIFTFCAGKSFLTSQHL
jgi:MFS family permease